MPLTPQKCYGVTYGFKRIVKDSRGADESRFQGPHHLNIVAPDEQRIFAVVAQVVTVPPGWTLEIENFKAVMSTVYAN